MCAGLCYYLDNQIGRGVPYADLGLRVRICVAKGPQGGGQVQRIRGGSLYVASVRFLFGLMDTLMSQ